jgi:C-terminal domain of Sin3a protein
MFFGLVLLLLSNDKRIESNSYEDKVRELCGKDAYLLFVFDKVVLNVSIKFCLLIFALDFKAHSKPDDKLGLYREY